MNVVAREGNENLEDRQRPAFFGGRGGVVFRGQKVRYCGRAGAERGYDSGVDDLILAWATYLDVLAVEAPWTRAALLPAGELDIDGAQQQLRGALLPELVTWFGLHGGSGYTFDCAILPFCMALDLPGAVSNSVLIRDIWQESRVDCDIDPGGEVSQLAGSVVFNWPNEYLLIGTDGGGGGLFVDQRSGPEQGCVRWWDKVEADNSAEDVAAASLLQLIMDLAPAIRNRTPIAGWVPEVVDGALDWDVAD